MANMHAQKTLFVYDCLCDFDFEKARDTLFGILDFYGTDAMPLGPALRARYRAAGIDPGPHAVFVTLILEAYVTLCWLVDSGLAERMRDLRRRGPAALEAAIDNTPYDELVEAVCAAADVLGGEG